MSCVCVAVLVPITGMRLTVRAPGSSSAYAASLQPVSFASPAFERVWERTDRLVSLGQVQRTWYWGPSATTGGLQEEYVEGAGGRRLVQYFDKSRMELNNPAGDPNNAFFVSNGLLAVELISGKMQTGNATYIDRYPADIPLASDLDDSNAPTYLSFQGVSNTPLGDHPSNSSVGRAVTATIARDGTVGDDLSKAILPKIAVAYFEPTTRHNIPEAIWEFLNAQGPVLDPATNRTLNARLSEPWFYATGLPISEAYWARVKIAGRLQDVLIQAFERRVVTYTPSEAVAFRVQMGNIGAHYFQWRYNNAGRPGSNIPLPTPTATPRALLPTPVLPTAAPNLDCSDIPPSRNMTISPTNCGQSGTVFSFVGRGFRAGEEVVVYLKDPDATIFGTPVQFAASEAGTTPAYSFASEPGMPGGIWTLVMEGLASGNMAVGYFKLGQDPATKPRPTVPPGINSCDGIPPAQKMEVLPSNCAKAGTTFSFVGRGFEPHEQIGVYLTAPDGAVVPASFQVEADRQGIAGSISFTSQYNFPLGTYAFTMEGVSSGRIALGYFKLLP